MSSLISIPLAHFRHRFAMAAMSSLFTAGILSTIQLWPSVLASFNPSDDGTVPILHDSDGDGLTDQREMSYGTDIHTQDSDGDGYGDGTEVAHGYDPRGTGAMAVETGMPAAPHGDRDHDGLSDHFEARLRLNPQNSDTDHDGFPDGTELHAGFDPTGPGMLEVALMIPALEIQAPLVWSASTAPRDLERDLARGVIHYPGTAAPGQEGNTFVTGHSSDYFWQKGAYKDVFKNLPQLREGDEVIFYLKFKNGRRQEIVYRLTEKLIVYPDDPRLFAPSPSPLLTLVTCYPIGSNVQRIAWRGVLED